MSRRPAAVTQADWARALRAAEQVKPGGFAIELRDGALRVVPASPVMPLPIVEAPEDPTPKEEFDPI